MRELFNMDGPIFVFLSKVADIMILNVIFLICCIPVITIGPALTALSYVTQKMEDGREGYIWRSFFHSFRENFRQAVLMWLMMLAAAVVLFMDWYLLHIGAAGHNALLIYAIVIATIIWVCFMLYLFPVLARFENSIANTFRNTFLLIFANGPRTLLMLAVTLGSIFLTIYNVNTLVWGLLVWLMAGFALLSLINTKLLMPVFRKLTPKEEESENPDAWVLRDEEQSDGAEEDTGAASDVSGQLGEQPEESREAENRP